MTFRCEAFRYSFYDQAAEEARQASRRYWAKGGPADRAHPQQPMPWWPETPEIEDNTNFADRRRKRQRR